MRDEIAPSTGPMADKTFKQGFAVVFVTTAVGVLAVATSDVWPFWQAIAVGTLTAPVIIIAGSCVLGVWLGYSDEARYQGARVALENNRRE